MRFKDLSQAYIQEMWETWHCTIRDLVDEFNEDVFNGRGTLCEHRYFESPYLFLETKQGCLYVFPLPGDEFVLRLYKQKLAKTDPTMVAAMSQPGEENYLGGIRIPLHNSNSRMFRNALVLGLRTIYSEYWRSLLY